MEKTAITSLSRNSLRVLKLVWGWTPWLIIGISSMLVLGTVAGYGRQAAQAFLVNELVRSTSGVLSALLPLAVALFAVMFILPQIFYAVRSYFSRIFRFRLEEKVDFLFFEKRGALDVAHWEDPKKNDLLTITDENEHRLYNFAERFGDVLEGVVTVVIGASILAAYKWWTLPLVVVATVPELIVQLKYGKRVWGIFHGRAETRRRYVAFMHHFYNVTRVIELKLFQNISRFLDVIRGLYRSFQDEQIANERRRFRYSFLAFIAGGAGIIAVALAFIGDVVAARLEIGTFIFIIGAAVSFRSAVSGLFNTLGSQYEDNRFVSEIFRLLDLPAVIQEPAHPEILIASVTPEVVFENVSFSYPGATRRVLENVSFRIAPGEKIALVGRNGAGKTTLVKLLCRFYDPTEGRITVGGYDLRTIDRESWYAKLGILFQEFAHYEVSVEKAIAMGRSSVPMSQERVREAAQMSGATSFIEAWDDEYRQMLGRQFSGGVEPSLGQWQRLALARVFYRKAQVIVLDEPTASIDAEGEAEIFERFEKLSADQSVILISHRFSTVRKASKIIVLDEGHVVEAGSHEKLAKAPKGLYAHLFALQAKGYE